MSSKKLCGHRATLGIAAVAWFLLVAAGYLAAQTDCMEGNHPLESGLPAGLTEQELIQRFTAGEDKVRQARAGYSVTRDVLIQTLDDKTADGQWHEVAQISYDSKGKPTENVTYSEVSTLRGIQISEADKDDIRTYMPWVFTSDQLPDYKLTYAGQQHVDDLDTYVFHVDPAKLEKNKRYFQGKIWVDNRDLEMVKLCGKSAELVHAKKRQAAEIRPRFVGYRQLVDGWWFPAYARVDDSLQFGVQSVHVREVVKFRDYRRSTNPPAPAKP